MINQNYNFRRELEKWESEGGYMTEEADTFSTIVKAKTQSQALTKALKKFNKEHTGRFITNMESHYQLDSYYFIIEHQSKIGRDEVWLWTPNGSLGEYKKYYILWLTIKHPIAVWKARRYWKERRRRESQ